VADRRRRCWDTQACLAWLNAEPDSIDGCKVVLDAVEDGTVELVVSSLALVEVLFVRGQPPLKREQSKTISAFFKRPGIVVVNVDRRIAQLARDVHWDFGVSPRDAVHVATALYAKATHLDTRDKELLALTGKVGGSPALAICRPGDDMQWALPLEAPGPGTRKAPVMKKLPRRRT
jgi:predicted nucleic acid-binding protein